MKATDEQEQAALERRWGKRIETRPMFVIKSDIRDVDMECASAKDAGDHAEYELSHGANHVEIIRGVAAMPNAAGEPLPPAAVIDDKKNV